MTDVLKQVPLLLHSPDLLRIALVENAPDAVIGVDSQGRVIDWNRKAEKLFGYKDDEVLGLTWASFVSNDERTSGDPRSEALALTRTDGPIPVELTAVPLQIRRESYLYYFVRDIRLQRRHERETLEALRVRDEFLSVASHELKTPLTPIKLQLQNFELAIRNGKEEQVTVPRLQKMIANSCRQIDRLIRLVDDLLDYSRMNAGRLTLERETVQVADLLREICEKYEFQAKSVGCTLELDIQPGLDAEIDPRRMEQVVTNLLTNAFRYAPQGCVKIHLSGTTSQITLRVADEGPGISFEDQQRIFDRYEQAKQSSFVGGLGLGLFLCRQIIEAHRGEIWVENGANEKGTVFTIQFPRNTKPVALSS